MRYLSVVGVRLESSLVFPERSYLERLSGVILNTIVYDMAPCLFENIVLTLISWRWRTLFKQRINCFESLDFVRYRADDVIVDIWNRCIFLSLKVGVIHVTTIILLISLLFLSILIHPLIYSTRYMHPHTTTSQLTDWV